MVLTRTIYMPVLCSRAGSLSLENISKYDLVYDILEGNTPSMQLPPNIFPICHLFSSQVPSTTPKHFLSLSSILKHSFSKTLCQGTNDKRVVNLGWFFYPVPKSISKLYTWKWKVQISIGFSIWNTSYPYHHKKGVLIQRNVINGILIMHFERRTHPLHVPCRIEFKSDKIGI